MSLLQSITRFKNSFIEQRRSNRENVQMPAWIELSAGSEATYCTVLDMSAEGARIALPVAAELPEEFRLLFSRDGRDGRRCRLIWRLEDQIGVNYLEPVRSNGVRAI
jgi:hypothetical protein